MEGRSWGADVSGPVAKIFTATAKWLQCEGQNWQLNDGFRKSKMETKVFPNNRAAGTL